MIEWLAAPQRPVGLPAAWLIDLADKGLRLAALALEPSPEDLARAASRPAAEREDVLVRRGLVRLCAASALGADPAELAILWSAQGAPRLGRPFDGHHLSWAQRSSRFACALALRPIGIDIEIADGGEIPWNMLHAQEAAALRAAAQGEREGLFLRIWAAKEAYAKALGVGFRREPTEFAVHLEEGEGSVEDSQAAAPQSAAIVFAPVKDMAVVVAVALA
jgi:4'-phosphopantetheinyl transferase